MGSGAQAHQRSGIDGPACVEDCADIQASDPWARSKMALSFAAHFP
jgi:hypothetical protein